MHGIFVLRKFLLCIFSSGKKHNINFTIIMQVILKSMSEDFNIWIICVYFPSFISSFIFSYFILSYCFLSRFLSDFICFQGPPTLALWQAVRGRANHFHHLWLSWLKAGFSFCESWSVLDSFWLLGMVLSRFSPRPHLLGGAPIPICVISALQEWQWFS